MTVQSFPSEQLLVADHLEVLNLYARYNHSVDSAAFDAWANCFVEDGALEIPSVGAVYRGWDKLREFGAQSVGPWNGLRRHITTNIEVSGSGDAARGRAYLLVAVGGSRQAPPLFQMSGRYEDELQRTPGGWRFVTRVLTSDAP